MKKQEFLNELRKQLAGLPKDDLDNRINFYEEMINDRMDEGLSEEEAVADIGTVDDIVKQIASETPMLRLVAEKAKPKRTLRVWEIVLIVLGFPLWLPLLIVGLVLLFVGMFARNRTGGLRGQSQSGSSAISALQGLVW